MWPFFEGVLLGRAFSPDQRVRKTLYAPKAACRLLVPEWFRFL